MKFSEIATRLTGISCPVFGVSWSPPEAEVSAAKRVIAFLKDRRVLYNPTEMEIPSHCVASVLDIRRFLTDELGRMDPHDELAQNLQAMRAACRRFLDDIQQLSGYGSSQYDRFLSGPIQSMGSFSAWVFCSALGELRAAIGLHLALLAVRNGLDMESGLAATMPAKPDEDDSIVQNQL